MAVVEVLVAFLAPSAAVLAVWAGIGELHHAFPTQELLIKVELSRDIAFYSHYGEASHGAPYPMQSTAVQIIAVGGRTTLNAWRAELELSGPKEWWFTSHADLGGIEPAVENVDGRSSRATDRVVIEVAGEGDRLFPSAERAIGPTGEVLFEGDEITVSGRWWTDRRGPVSIPPQQVRWVQRESVSSEGTDDTSFFYTCLRSE